MKAMAMGVERRTSADLVFDSLSEKIRSLELLPGSRISEAEIAQEFSVSRQPVHDAFTRLGNMNLLLIQPQRATEVRKFSMSAINNARFVRQAIELEICRAALERWSDDWAAKFEAELGHQQNVVDKEDRAAFHDSDMAFHSLIAEVADKPIAFQMVLENKAQIDRICTLSLKEQASMQTLVEDHRALFQALSARDFAALEATLRLHLSRIESTIEEVHAGHSEFFED